MPQHINYSGNAQEDLDRLRDAVYTLENFGIIHEDTNNSIEYDTAEWARELLGVTEEQCDEEGWFFYELFEECDDKQKQQFLEFYRDAVMEQI